jgi:hypothetical protein
MYKNSGLCKVLINIPHSVLEYYAVLTNDHLLSICNVFFGVRKSEKDKA